MDPVLGFEFTAESVVAFVMSAWAVGLLLGGITALLSALAARR